MSSVLAAVREAMRAPIYEDSPVEGEVAGAQASIETSRPPRAKETGMSGQNAPAAAGTITQAGHDAAVSTAETRGHAAGVTAENRRLSTALGTDGVKGDGGRMAAALDLATKSPAMSGEDVAAFVVANVAASRPAPTGASAYEQSRVAGAGLAQPARPSAGGQANGGQASWADFRARRQPAR